MSALGKLKCYVSSFFFFWAIYHVLTTCPLCEPLPYELQSGNDSLCYYSHQGYSYIKPYTEPYTAPAIEYYNASPIKTYVDNIYEKSVEIVGPLAEEYYPIIESHTSKVYDYVVAKALELKNILDNDELSNMKIVIPENDNIGAFIGTPNPEQEKEVEPVTPAEDVVEPTPETEPIANYIPETNEEVETETVSSASQAEEIEPIAPETDAPVETEEAQKESKFQKIVEEAEDIVKNVIVEEVIEAAEAIAQQL